MTELYHLCELHSSINNEWVVLVYEIESTTVAITIAH